MRIVLSATNITRGNRGGAATFVWGLAEGLAVRDDVDLAIIAPAHLVPTCVSSRVEVFPVPEVRGARRVLHDLRSLPRASRSWRPQLLHYPHEWCPRSDIPVVTTVQNIGWMHPLSSPSYGRRGRAMRTLTRATYRKAASLTAVSPLAADLFSSLTGAPRAAVAVLPEGCHKAQSRPREGKDPAGSWLLITGQAEYKRAALAVDAYCQAAAQEPLPPLLVAGLESRHDPVPGVTYLGWLSRNELLDRMVESRLCIFPSAVESFGLPALESIAAGTPCIVQHGTAMEQWLGSSVTTFDGTTAGLRNTLLAGAWCDNADFESDASFEWSAVAEQWVRHYSKVLRG